MRFVIDRIEENVAVCVADGDRLTLNVKIDRLASLLGREPKRNDIFDGETDGGQIVKAVPLDYERDAVLEKNKSRLAALFGRTNEKKEKTMREYTIRRYRSYDEVDWADVPVAPIDIYRWLPEYAPKAGAQVVMIEGFGFAAHLWCYESKPMAKRTEFFSDVWCDSCLEFFASWDNTKTEYTNIEMNSISTSHIGFGPGRYGRRKVTDFIEKPFTVRSVVRDDKWSVTAFIPFADLEKLYGIDRSIFRSGYSFRGNFYKCGDETAVEHYGVWNDIELDDADYHVPEFFGKLTIE